MNTLNTRVIRGKKCECEFVKMSANQTRVPMVKFVSGKLVYQGVEDISNKPAERLICQDCYAQMGQGIPHPCT